MTGLGSPLAGTLYSGDSSSFHGLLPSSFGPNSSSVIGYFGGSGSDGKVESFIRPHLCSVRENSKRLRAGTVMSMQSGISGIAQFTAANIRERWRASLTLGIALGENARGFPRAIRQALKNFDGRAGLGRSAARSLTHPLPFPTSRASPTPCLPCGMKPKLVLS